MWDLKIGDTLDRPALHARLGGRTASRISPSTITPAVMLFLAPGMPGSWFDGWTGPGGHVHFCGEGGTTGADQRFLSGNRSIRDHRDEGRELRLFHCSPHRLARYVGRFQLDPDQPHFRVDAPTDLRRPHEIRSVIVFRLQPLDGEPTGLPPVPPVAAEKQLLRTEPAIPITRLGVRPSHRATSVRPRSSTPATPPSYGPGAAPTPPATGSRSPAPMHPSTPSSSTSPPTR